MEQAHDKNINELANMDINELYDWLMKVDEFLSDKQKKISVEILKEIRTRLKFLLDVGLDYLALNRSSVSLSGGESQRIRLATQIGSQLVNVLYILDEPSIGLHQRDNLRLINSLKELRDILHKAHIRQEGNSFQLFYNHFPYRLHNVRLKH